ncbi:hypothetical protein Tco_0195602 [Tanacetum coccineum]
MMTYLKHVGNFKHSDLKTKKFEEIQALYEKIKRSDEDFIAIGSAEDERQVKKMNKEPGDPKKKELKKKVVKEEDTVNVPAEQEVTDTIDSEVMETKSVVAKLHKVSSPDGDYLVVYKANGNFRAFNYLIDALHIFDRQDLFYLYELVMKQYSEITLEEWEIIRWSLYEACRVCILELKDGTIIYMLVERRYPLSKELLQRMLDLGLEVKKESTAALHLVRFIKQQLDEE